MMDRHRQVFLEEANELLRELEASLLELEERPSDAELVGRAFRALHTIKGSGAMFGFDEIAAFAHALESAFDAVRDGSQPVGAALIGVSLDARDHIQQLLQAGAQGKPELAARSSAILERLHRAAPRREPAASTCSQQSAPASVEAPGELRSYRIRFDPSPEIFLTGTNPLALFQELARMGDFSVAAHLNRIPDLEGFKPDECCTWWDGILTTSSDENAIRDVFIFVEDRAVVEIERIEAPGNCDGPALSDVLVDRAASPACDRVAGPPAGAADCCGPAAPIGSEELVAAALEQRHLAAVHSRRAAAESAATLRVPAAKLDSLVNIVGELVTVQARLTNYALSSGDPEIGLIAEDVERLAEMLRDNAMSIRMLPIGDTFSRFKRLVRDLSVELGKKVELSAEGSDTELDKTVIEQLADPLVHLIRNAVDHGIEPPAERAAAGKPAVGHIHLSAAHSGAFVVLRITDDGAGMNREAIRARAVERGMISPDAVLTDEQVFALTLEPGFSTAHEVTSISGRGVGMDVVRRSLESLRGSMSISSVPGRGTEIALKIPLTLAIIEGLLVSVDRSLFVLPLGSIVECVEIEGRALSRKRSSFITVRGALVPYIVLRDYFAIAGESPRIEQVIVAETRSGRRGFVVDRVIGDHHTVIKKLGGLYRDVEEVSGATITGDGTVALILDVDKIAA